MRSRFSLPEHLSLNEIHILLERGLALFQKGIETGFGGQFRRRQRRDELLLRGSHSGGNAAAVCGVTATIVIVIVVRWLPVLLARVNRPSGEEARESEEDRALRDGVAREIIH